MKSNDLVTLFKLATQGNHEDKFFDVVNCEFMAVIIGLASLLKPFSISISMSWPQPHLKWVNYYSQKFLTTYCALIGGTFSSKVINWGWDSSFSFFFLSAFAIFYYWVIELGKRSTGVRRPSISETLMDWFYDTILAI